MAPTGELSTLHGSHMEMRVFAERNGIGYSWVMAGWFLSAMLTEEHGLWQDARTDFMRTVICRKEVKEPHVRLPESTGIATLKSKGESWGMCFDITTG